MATATIADIAPTTNYKPQSDNSAIAIRSAKKPKRFQMYTHGAVVLGVTELALLPERRGHLEECRPVVARVEVAELQAARLVVRVVGVVGALVGVLQPPVHLRHAHVRLPTRARAHGDLPLELVLLDCWDSMCVEYEGMGR